PGASSRGCRGRPAKATGHSLMLRRRPISQPYRARSGSRKNLASFSSRALHDAWITLPRGWEIANREQTSLAIYSSAQVTWLFQSTNAPWGLSRQAQTWSSKKAGILNRLGLSTYWKTCPSNTGGVLLLVSQGSANTMNSTPTSCILPPFDGS